MGVKDRQGCVFLGQVSQNCEQNRVLENVGMVPSVEGVAVTKHASMVTTAWAQRSVQRCQHLHFVAKSLGQAIRVDVDIHVRIPINARYFQLFATRRPT